MAETTEAATGKLLAYLRLCRLPNLFTAAADVMMGYLFVHRELSPPAPFVALLAATCCLYTGGIVLNDVCDIDVDRRERPRRPLPAGLISWSTARGLAAGLLLIGCLCAALAGWLAPEGQRYFSVSATLGLLLVAAIVGYDTLLKHTPLFPLGMGLCRFFNVLLGMSAAGMPRPDGWLAGFQPHHLMVAAAIGTHIAGVTIFSRGEAGQSRRGLLLLGMLVMAAGWWMLAWFPRVAPAGFTWRMAQQPLWYYAVLALLAYPLLRRCLQAVASPEPRNVQAAVKQGIWVLIWMDAVVVAVVASLGWSLLIVALFVPMLVLGRWVYST
jgi:4-hydroxybenzoate polyprenyltransferase